MSPDSSVPAGPAPAGAGRGRAASAGDADPVLDLVDAVRRYRDAESSMRGQSRESMHLGRTDMTALRLMLRARQAGHPLSAAALSRELGISSAATTVLVDRLEQSGHAERRRSSTDGRAIEVWPTATTEHEVRSTMGTMHERMMQIASALPPEDCSTIHRFLDALGQAMTELDFPATGTAGPPA
ncbi:MarR family winged helix-turn-helix transcriptional regulator [Arthrobacter sp. SX1312]|uniref:MarR family winged helix-turn-helix transcriptional regulator n=1 Tax=Arthrobacter sp. SX1312 TaxID=2058896 RepID=UPI000CE328B0|nr:MarR family transcriptional regulator [Arthrobacter sp. SX1312]